MTDSAQPCILHGFTLQLMLIISYHMHAQLYQLSNVSQRMLYGHLAAMLLKYFSLYGMLLTLNFVHAIGNCYKVMI